MSVNLSIHNGDRVIQGKRVIVQRRDWSLQALQASGDRDGDMMVKERDDEVAHYRRLSRKKGIETSVSRQKRMMR